ncbi:MAG: hypothetical protein BMS9Abin28_1306 [Anaerolineae bacterium]|nr:MAG: hypothetical protein BMS9Abin28_1306 [Anaerolineae bacterium]
MDEVPRSRAARVAAETALVRVVHHYGERPEFVVLGGLVPELLCAASPLQHAGTTDVDVQVNLEIAGGSIGAVRLERALRDAEFAPVDAYVWRWEARALETPAVVRFELLADLDDQPDQATIVFDRCEWLGAVNLRGSGFAARDLEVRELSAKIGRVLHTVEVNVSGLGGFLLAKARAAYSRRRPKDWYDIAFVLLHNDAGGPDEAAAAVLDRFGDDILGATHSAIADLRANFAEASAQGPRAYVEQMLLDQPDIDQTVTAADSVAAVERFSALVLR